MKRLMVLPRIIPLLVFGILFAGISRAQVPVWVSRWDPGFLNWAEVQAMALCPDGDLVATGFSEVTWTTYQSVTVKFASDDGEILWAQTRPVSSGVRDDPTGIAVDEAGNVFVCGETRVSGRSDWLALKYAPDGTLEWEVVYNAGTEDVAAAVVADGSGGCFVAGRSNGELVVVRYDDEGDEVWMTRLNAEPGGDAAAAALVACESGYLYAAGYRWTGSDDKEAYWLVKLDPVTGDTAWTRTYNGSAGPWDPRDDRAYALALGPGGNIYVTGRASEYGTWYDATTVAWDPDGNELWVNRFDAGRLYEDGAGELAVCPAGYVYCGGYTFDYHEESEKDFLVFRIRPDGETDWFRVWDGGFEEPDSCTGIAVDAFGNLYATGVVGEADGATDWMVVKYNSRGQEVWRSFAGVVDEYDNPNAILLDAHGAVYVGGMDVESGGEDLTVRKYGQSDAAATRIISPADTLRLGAEIYPRVWVVNNSPGTASFPVWCYIGDFYFDVQEVTGLPSRDSVLVEFRSWEVRDIGHHPVLFFTALPGDHEPGNDSVFGTVTTVPVWELLAPMPYSATTRARPVRDGGALVAVEDTLVFGFKGGNTTEFYRYNTLRDTWIPEDTIPAFGSAGRRRRVRRGARLTADRRGRIYGIKGNNTLEFWRYDFQGDSMGWQELAEYPIDPSARRLRRLRGGTGLQYVESLERIYSTKGSNTFEFYAYDIAADTWLQMADAHAGPRNRPVRNGSCIVYDGDNTIYLLKGRTQEFAAYSIADDAWTGKPDLPFTEYGRRNRTNRGAGMAWDPVNERLYVAKGRRSTEWWYFDVGRDAWVEVERDTIPMGPSNRAPANGSAMTMADGKIYFLKGNRTVEFWRYNADLPLNPGGGTDGGPAALPAVAAMTGPDLTAVPNPIAGRGELRFALPRAGRAQLVLYDVSGRVALRLLDEPRDAGQYRLALSSAGLARGVYLARLTLATPDGELLAAERKLLIAR